MKYFCLTELIVYELLYIRVDNDFMNFDIYYVDNQRPAS